MRRTVLSVALTAFSITTAYAGPLSLYPPSDPGVSPPFAASRAPSRQPAPAPVPAQPAAAQNFGGGFLEFLFGGRSSGTYEVEPQSAYAGRDASAYAGRNEASVDARYLRQEVLYDGDEKAGTIVIDTNERLLYFVQDGGRAMRYGIGVGRPGFTWAGVHHVTQMREWPDWTPPPEMLKRRPDLPRHMEGGPENPLGARAMYLGSTLYRIHGSNEPWTIGTQVSSGCIRLRNEDVIDLYGRVKVGTKVIVL
jgi:lipoprotein-anchoring transpeptidase ErfK/SrfK